MIFYRFAHAVVWGACKMCFRMKIIGKEHVPKQGAFVAAPSHRSYIDTPFCAFVTRRRIRFMGKQELFRNKFGAWLFGALGAFPVARGTVDRSALREARGVLERGEPLAIFPEGTRRTGPVIGELFEGAAYLATKAGVPIVPVGIGGSEEILARGAKFPRFKRVVVVVGEPMQPPARDANRVEIAALTERLHRELQALFDEAQVLAGG
jgi:1-acyl-sn-glycerol-3-phosphate acyltransferase